jgi:hypothetical protein
VHRGERLRRFAPPFENDGLFVAITDEDSGVPAGFLEVRRIASMPSNSRG